MYTLAIIDMQPSFSASNSPSTIDGVIKEIEIAKSSGYPIALVEYNGFTSTLPAISNLIDSEPILKNCDDGSAELIQSHPQSSKFRLVGVNFDACVLDTAIGLRTQNKHVEVILRATNSASYLYDGGQIYIEMAINKYKYYGIPII